MLETPFYADWGAGPLCNIAGIEKLQGSCKSVYIVTRRPRNKVQYRAKAENASGAKC